jgi:hypothetical protein
VQMARAICIEMIVDDRSLPFIERLHVIVLYIQGANKETENEGEFYPYPRFLPI